jgi:hypothetical protein
LNRKKGWLWLGSALFVYLLVTNPTVAAKLVHNGFGLFAQFGAALGKFMGAL